MEIKPDIESSCGQCSIISPCIPTGIMHLVTHHAPADMDVGPVIITIGDWRKCKVCMLLNSVPYTMQQEGEQVWRVAKWQGKVVKF